MRTAGRVTAVLQDEGSSRPAARAMGAFASDATAHPTGGSAQAVRAPLGSSVEEGGWKATVSASLEEAFKNAPGYSESTRSGARRRNKEAGLSGGRSLSVEEMLGVKPFIPSQTEGAEAGRSAVRGAPGLPRALGSECVHGTVYWAGEVVNGCIGHVSRAHPGARVKQAHGVFGECVSNGSGCACLDAPVHY